MGSRRRKRAKRVETLVIDRSRWLRGNVDMSVLRDHDGNMCCLGFYSLALGLSEDDILECGAPDAVGREAGCLYPEWLHDGKDNSEAANVLMQINDDKGLEDRQREREIARKFKQAGVAAKFVGRGRPEVDE